MQDAEMIYDSFYPMLNPKLKKRPTDYWRECCFATFMSDSLGLKLLDYVGADRLLWSSDYPHSETTFPNSQVIVKGNLVGVVALDRVGDQLWQPPAAGEDTTNDRLVDA